MSLLRKVFSVRPRQETASSAPRSGARTYGDSSKIRINASLDVSERGSVVRTIDELIASDELVEALAVIDRSLATEPSDPELLLLRSTTMMRLGRIEEAIEWCDRAQKLSLDTVAFHSRIGFALMTMGRTDAAEAAMRKALAIDPDSGKLHFGLGLALRAQKRNQEAIAAFERALALQPNQFDCLIGLSACALGSGDPSAGEAYARRAIALDARRPIAWNHLGIALDQQDRFQEAIETFQHGESLALSPRDIVDGFTNVGIGLHDAGRIDEAIAVYRHNLPQWPSVPAHLSYALSLLTTEQFTEGWEQYEFRLFKEDALLRRNNFERPAWSGQSLQGRTVLLRAEQGAGDTIQFLRYAPQLKALGADVIVHFQRGFGKLAGRFDGVDSFIEEGALPGHDFQAHLLSLPRVFATDLGSIPAQVPYVDADPHDVERWRGRLDGNGKLRVGLVWAGNAGHRKDRYRSLSLRSMLPLLQLEGVQFFSLQKGEPATEINDVRDQLDLIDLGPELDDYSDTAAVVSQLDLIISVDTSVAHLAGAMAKPIWTLLPMPSDWRWLLAREDTPWYPTMRLFRQTSRGNWTNVVDRVTQALQQSLRAGETAASMNPGLRESTPSAEAHVPPERATVRTKPSALSAVAETRVGLLQFFPGDEATGPSIEFYGEYLQPQLDLLGYLIRPGDVILEAFANVGAHVLALSKAVGGSGAVIAYETHPVLNQVLRQNLAANKAGNVTVIDRVLGGPSGDFHSMREQENVDGLALERLSLLKLSEAVEPGEVLKGAANTLWNLRPTVFLSVRSEVILGELADQLKEFGYRCWRFEAPLFNPENFNRRENDIFAGRAALALLAMPEEFGDELSLPGCTALIP